MKMYLLTALTVVCLAASGFAGNNNTTKQWLFKPLAANEVSIEVERIGDEVMVYLYSQNMRNMDALVIEKSSNGNEFKPFKTVKVAEHLTKSKNYIQVTDETPFAATTESYYRIKATNKNGVTTIYQAPPLAALQYIEPVEFVENQR